MVVDGWWDRFLYEFDPGTLAMVDRLSGYIELCRPVNAVAAGGLTFTGAFVAGGTTSDLFFMGAAVVATVLATAAGNAINDYFDREIDRVNAPDRPIPRGAVPPRNALLFSGVLFAAAVAITLVLPVLAIAIALINLVALVAYTRVFKGLPGAGNAVVAYLGGSTFLFGGAAVERLDGVWILFVLAALATLTREIIKDVEDIEGDQAAGLQTLPITIGPRPALFIGGLLLLIAVAASPIPYLLGTFGLVYLAVVVPADLIMLVAAYESFSDPTAGQRHLKYGMFLAGVAFIIGRLLGA